MENNEVKKKSKKKIVKTIILILLVVVLIILSPLLFLVGSIFTEMIFDRPSKPEIKHAEVPFVLVYEDNGNLYSSSMSTRILFINIRISNRSIY